MSAHSVVVKDRGIGFRLQVEVLVRFDQLLQPGDAGRVARQLDGPGRGQAPEETGLDSPPFSNPRRLTISSRPATCG